MIVKNNVEIYDICKGTDYIYKVYKGTLLVHKAWELLTESGATPLTLNFKRPNFVDYKVYGNIQRGELPSAYTQVDYIESTGTQYLDLDFKANQDTKLLLDYQQTQVYDSAIWFFGARNSDGTKAYSFIIGSDGNYATPYNRSAGNATFRVNASSVSNDTNRHVFIKQRANDGDTKMGEFDGDVVRVVSTDAINQSAYTTFKTSYNVMLFSGKMGNYNTAPIKMKVYQCKVWENGTDLTKNLIPCYRNSDNEVGMYDTVNDIFYTNQGTDSFIAGNDLPNLENPLEIKTVGDLVTDTSDTNYGKYKIPIVATKGSENITTNIYLDAPLRKTKGGTDYIDFQNQKIYRYNAEYIVTGQESWITSGSGVYSYERTRLSSSSIIGTAGASYQICNYFKYGAPITSNTTKGISMYYSTSSPPGTYLRIRDDNLDTKEKVSAFFLEKYQSGNPAKIIYFMHDPVIQTIQLPEVLTQKGTNIISVGTELQPTSISVTYKGVVN